MARYTPSCHIRKSKELAAWRQVLRRSELFAEVIGRRPPIGITCFGVTRCFSTSSNLNQNDNKDGEKENNGDGIPPQTWLIFLLYIFACIQLISRAFGSSDNANLVQPTITWVEFLNDLLLKGEVEQAIVRDISDEQTQILVKLHRGAVFKGFKGVDVFQLNMPNANQFEEKLRNVEDSIGIKPGQGIPVQYRRASFTTELIKFALVCFFLLNVFYMLKRVKMPGTSDMFSSFTQAKYTRADVLATGKKGISFKDVAGLHEAKMEIMEFVDYLKNPQRFKTLGAKVPKGALLTGPPGCGKTLLAKALATEAQVPFLVMAGSEFVEMIGGLGASRVRNLFKDARSKAPCIIYVDEIDAIGKKRSGNNIDGSGDGEQTLNQLLVELDGMGTVDGVIMLASTNRVDVLDKALLRPGRFDRHILLDLPTLAERKEIFEMYLRKLKLNQPVTDFSERLSQLSPGMSGADISNICNEAALFAARNNKKVVESSDFDYAVERVVVGAVKKSRVLSVKEKKVIAYHEAGHALVAWLMQHTDTLLRVSIIPRTNATLGSAQYIPEDRFLQSKEELFAKMCMMLGGRAAESLIFNNVTSGAQDDLKKVTQMANLQIKVLGMSDVIGHLSFESSEEGNFMKKPYSKRLANQMDQEASLLVTKAYQAAEKLLKENEEKLRAIAEALLEKEVLNYKDVEQLIGPRPHKKHGHVSDWTPAS